MITLYLNVLRALIALFKCCKYAFYHLSQTLTVDCHWCLHMYNITFRSWAPCHRYRNIVKCSVPQVRLRILCYTLQSRLDDGLCCAVALLLYKLDCIPIPRIHRVPNYGYRGSLIRLSQVCVTLAYLNSFCKEQNKKIILCFFVFGVRYCYFIN